jgi:putative transposase
MPDYRRYYVPNAIVFVVAVTKDRRRVFGDTKHAELLLQVLRDVRQYRPFSLLAHSIIPDHVNLLLKPTGESNFSQIMHSVERSLTLRYKKIHGITGSLSLWQRGFWDHVIRDEEDLRRHFDYVHYNPVKHRLVTRPEDYAYSSYGYWLEKGYYEVGWGYAEPESIGGMEFE